MTRVLICDDSATCRAYHADLLRTDPTLQVVGEAKNGQEAVRLAAALRPDLILMDLWMPGMDGLAATREVMATAPARVVVVTASSAAAEVATGLQALQAGALALLPKPVGGPPDAEPAIKLVQTVKTMAGVRVARLAGETPLPPMIKPLAPRPRLRGVAVASSTGGPAALQQLVAELPSGFPASVLIVQHIAPVFTPGLAAWLNLGCSLRVKVAEAGEPLRPGTVRGPGRASPGSDGDGRPAQCGRAGRRVPAGRDGLVRGGRQGVGGRGRGRRPNRDGDGRVAGLPAVRAAGGVVFAQDESSSVVYGMPGAAAAAGLADNVLSPAAIAARLRELAKP